MTRDARDEAPAFFEGTGELARLVDGEAGGPAAPGSPAGFAIDTRVLPARGLFFALAGENTDGHRFLEAAAAAGAWGAVVSDRAAAEAAGLPFVLVDDVAEALRKLAAAKRALLDYPMVAITGSNGKTSTKDLIAAVLGREKRVARSLGNFNNLLGLPLSLLAAPLDADVGVFELGMSTPGEIDALGALLRPAYGVITNVSEAHLETLGSLEAVRDAKAELIGRIEEGGVLYLNADDPSAAEMARRAEGLTVRRVSTRGLLEAQVIFIIRGVDLAGTDGELSVDRTDGGRRDQFDVRWPIPGRHLVYPLMFAVLLARDLGIRTSDELLRDLGEHVAATPGRMQVLDLGGVRVIDDSYNANPASVRAALDFMAEVDVPGKRFVVLGDMLELGAASGPCHRALFERVADDPAIEAAWFVGPEYAEAVATREGAAGVAATEDRDAVVAALAGRLEAGDLLLVKGSRGIALDRVVAALVARLGGGGC